MAKTNLAHAQTGKEETQLLVKARVRDRKKMLEASGNIDKLRRKTSGPKSVQMIRRFRGKI